MRIQKKLIVGLMLFVLTLGLSVPLMNQTAYAQLSTDTEVTKLIASLEFKNSGTITGIAGGQEVPFIKGTCDNPSPDRTYINLYVSCFKASALSCEGKVAAIYPDGNRYVFRYTLRSGGKCNNTPGEKAFNNIKAPGRERILASRLNEDTIVTSGGEKYIRATGNVYLRDSESGKKCQDFMQVNGNRATWFELREGSFGGNSNGYTTLAIANANQASIAPQAFGNHATGSDERECGILSINGIGMAQSDINRSAQKIAATVGQSFPLGTITAEELAALEGDEPAENEFTCDAKLSSVLSWILCPIINMAASFTEFTFDNFVRPFLESIPISSNPQDSTYKAWQQFRLLGNIVLVGTMIAVVYSQVRGDR